MSHRDTCSHRLLGRVGPFSNNLIAGRMPSAMADLERLSPLDAVRLVLATIYTNAATVGSKEAENLADALGVYRAIEEMEAAVACPNCDGYGYHATNADDGRKDCEVCGGSGFRVRMRQLNHADAEALTRSLKADGGR